MPAFRLASLSAACLLLHVPSAWSQQRAESAAVSADRVLSVRSVLGGDTPQWSPDGTRITFPSGLGGGNGLWAVNPDGGSPAMLISDIGGAPYQMPQSPRWAPTGQWVAYVSNKGGPAGAPDQPGPSDLWVWSPSEGREIQLTRMGARIGSFSWSPDGTWIVFSGGLSGSYDIWKVAVPGGEAHQLTRDARYEITPVWTPAGKILYFRTDDRWVDHEILEIAPEGGNPRVVLRDTDFFDYNTSGTPSFGPPLLSPDGKTILFRSWRSGWINYWLAPLAGGEPRALAAESADQAAASWSPDGRSVIYTSNRNGTHVLQLASVAGGPPKTLVNPPIGVVANPAWSPDGKRISYTLGTPTRANDLYVLSVAGGAPRQLTSSARDGVEAALITPEKISYKSDTLTINAYLYRPANLRPGERAPGIVFGHGGPTGQYGDTYEAQMQFFARQGYVVLAPNFRGGSGYGRAFADLNNKCWAHCDLKDLVAGVEYLKTLSYVNPNKMGVTGTSHGGLLSMAAATFAPGVFQASIPHGGTADRIHYYHTQELRHIKQAENEFGPLKGNEETYRYVSPFYFAREANTPMFVIWGEGRYPASDNSRRYVEELERNYKWGRSKVYPGENYYVTGRTNVRQMLIDMLDFFDQYLRDKIAPAPAVPPTP